MTGIISYLDLRQIAGDDPGISDHACPLCGPGRKSAINRRRKVLRVWHTAPGFMSYSCARCGARGYARAQGAVHLRPERVAEARAGEQQAAAATSAAKRDNARWLWSRRQLIEGTPAEIYLR